MKRIKELHCQNAKFILLTITQHVARFHLWGNKKMALGLGDLWKWWWKEWKSDGAFWISPSSLSLGLTPEQVLMGTPLNSLNYLRSSTLSTSRYQDCTRAVLPSTVVTFNLICLQWQHPWSLPKECGSFTSQIKASCHTNLNLYRLVKLRSVCQVTPGKASTDELLYSTLFPRLNWYVKKWCLPYYIQT